jgi:RimJ/RimL family protein N-acetyltransferase
VRGVIEPLDTERLHLRPFTEDDAEAWYAIWGDPEVIWWRPQEDFASATTGLIRLVKRHADWPDGIGWLAIVEPETGDVVGDVILQPAPFVDGIEVGWHLRRHVWGRGYATEAAEALIARAFRNRVVDRIWAIVAIENTRSLAVAARLGMKAERDMEWTDRPHRLFVIERPRPDLVGPA